MNGVDPSTGHRSEIWWEVLKGKLPDLLDFPRPGRLVADIFDDEERSEILLEVDLLIEFAHETDSAVRSHADFLAQLPKSGLAWVFAGIAAASRQTPSWRVTQFYENQLAIRSERERVRT